MRYHLFSTSFAGGTAILCKASTFVKGAIVSNYVTPLQQLGISTDNIIAFSLHYDANNKVNATVMKDYLALLLTELDQLGVSTLYVADASYFKTLTGQSKAEPHLGYSLPCKIKGYEYMNIVLGINYQALIFNTALQEKLDLSLATLASVVQGNYTCIGTGIIHSALYPDSLEGVKNALESLHQYDCLTCDIEAFSLRFNEAGIGSIAFAWDEHNGLAFACDYRVTKNTPGIGFYGQSIPNMEVRALLLKFFTEYKGKLIWHNASYDVQVIVYTLWMDNYLHTSGMLLGLDVMTRSFDDTKIIAYLATNTTAGNVLGLKALAHEFAGNYAKEDIKDIRRIPIAELLEYNLVDCLSTWFVYNKFMPVVHADNQMTIYEDLMLPSIKVIIQMQLTGMPMNPERLQEVKAELNTKQADYMLAITDSPVIKVLDLVIQTDAMTTANAKLKVKQHPLEKFNGVTFNPNSGNQLQKLLYEQMGLPILDYTDTKQPSTGADTIEKLINHTDEPSYKALLTALIGYGKVNKILTTFIPAFEKGIIKSDGMQYLHGSFNLGGTVSGRLSSSAPNLTNIPANSSYGKLIKECFSAPPGWLMVGADFSSLEDYVSALTTKDPEKLKVYTDGYCGHCLRAFKYFPEEMPDIIDTVESINSIKELYPKQRQDSKPGTFLLTYGGTYHGLMNNLGWDREKASRIEDSYHELYKVSDAFIQERLHQASKDGYVTVAFGLRVRTPLLKQVVFGAGRMPYEAAAEGRTAGNAMGQSYCLLNSRSANEFMAKVWASKYRTDILPIAQIHDAQYYLIRDDVEVVKWVNDELIATMRWQELEELKHDTVKIGASLDVFYKGWHQPVTLPNNATFDEIRTTAQLGQDKHDKPKTKK